MDMSDYFHYDRMIQSAAGCEEILAAAAEAIGLPPIPKGNRTLATLGDGALDNFIKLPVSPDSQECVPLGDDPTLAMEFLQESISSDSLVASNEDILDVVATTLVDDDSIEMPPNSPTEIGYSVHEGSMLPSMVEDVPASPAQTQMHRCCSSCSCLWMVDEPLAPQVLGSTGPPSLVSPMTNPALDTFSDTTAFNFKEYALPTLESDIFSPSMDTTEQNINKRISNTVPARVTPPPIHVENGVYKNRVAPLGGPPPIRMGPLFAEAQYNLDGEQLLATTVFKIGTVDSKQGDDVNAVVQPSCYPSEEDIDLTPNETYSGFGLENEEEDGIPQSAKPSFREGNSRAWTEMYQAAKAFAAEHKHCLISNRHPNKALAAWAKRQRFQYRIMSRSNNGGSGGKNSPPKGKSFLTPERIQLLNEVGFVWEIQTSIWAQRYEELIAYKMKYGNVNVPSNYPPNQKLATWVKSQRRQYVLRSPAMTPERVQALEQIGFIWKGARTTVVKKRKWGKAK